MLNLHFSFFNCQMYLDSSVEFRLSGFSNEVLWFAKRFLKVVEVMPIYSLVLLSLPTSTSALYTTLSIRQFFWSGQLSVFLQLQLSLALPKNSTSNNNSNSNSNSNSNNIAEVVPKNILAWLRQPSRSVLRITKPRSKTQTNEIPPSYPNTFGN